MQCKILFCLEKAKTAMWMFIMGQALTKTLNPGQALLILSKALGDRYSYYRYPILKVRKQRQRWLLNITSKQLMNGKGTAELGPSMLWKSTEYINTSLQDNQLRSP